jgi:hypothetical protein
VTGLAQVQLPPDTDLDSVRRKLVYDLHYAQQLSLGLDLRLLLATAAKVMGIPFWFTRTLLRLPSGLVEEKVNESPAKTGARVTKLMPALQEV